eukprot:TRINITY_DN3880_c0_g1_i1.p1 TRINITY_DN3880_c0_g1~~TRINITY_DN3880_c0_g1_i1.p1  ORF type:complete len:450 (+),score=114.76 TRINITY_DN3880_c0_g1_i1:67-1416(+)
MAFSVALSRIGVSLVSQQGVTLSRTLLPALTQIPSSSMSSHHYSLWQTIRYKVMAEIQSDDKLKESIEAAADTGMVKKVSQIMEAVDKTKTGISTVTSDALLKIQDAVDEAQGEDKEEELIKMKKLEEKQAAQFLDKRERLQTEQESIKKKHEEEQLGVVSTALTAPSTSQVMFRSNQILEDDALTGTIKKVTALMAHLEGTDQVTEEEKKTSYFDPSIIPDDETTDMVIHEPSRLSSQIAEMKTHILESKPVQTYEHIKEKVTSSDNKAVQFSVQSARLFKKGLTKIFGETKQAKALKAIKAVDPSFKLYNLLDDLEETVIPRVLKAFHEGDKETIRFYTEREAYGHMINALQELEDKGQAIDVEVLDLKELEFRGGDFLDGYPYLIFSFKIDQTTATRDIETGTIVEGGPENVQSVYYAWAIRPMIEENRRQWKILDLGINATHGTF